MAIKPIQIITLLVLLFTINSFSQSQTYYVSNAGDDSNSGSLSDPWRTIDKVNSFSFSSGDIVRFKQGDFWREQLIPQSGVSYEDYATGSLSNSKPQLVGSTSGSYKEKKWYEVGDDVYSTNLTHPDEVELLSNSTFDTNYDDWFFWKHVNADATRSISNSSLKIVCPESSTSFSHIQLFTRGFNIQENVQYKLSFKVKKLTSSPPIDNITVKLMEPQSPWTSYSNEEANFNIQNSDWETKVFFFDANTTTNDARITFYMGDSNDGWELYLDDISLEKMVAYTQEGELISNGQFDQGTNNWSLYAEGVSATFTNTSNAANILCSDCDNTSSNRLQFHTQGFNVHDDFVYRLTFKAKSTLPVDDIEIMLRGHLSPNPMFSNDIAVFSVDGDDWNYYVFYFYIDSNDTTVCGKYNEPEPGEDPICLIEEDRDLDPQNARLTFYLGNTVDYLNITLDDISLQKIVDDAGSIYFNVEDVQENIFDHEANYTFGYKKPNLTSLEDNLDFYSQPNSTKLYLKTDINPINDSSNFEIALNRDILFEKGLNKTDIINDHVSYTNLDFRFGGASGINGWDNWNIHVKQCGFYYLGGGYQPNRINTGIRYGNGMTFWGNAINILVEQSRFHQIYDNAVTEQTKGVDKKQSNIIYRNNLISNCELPYEHWNGSTKMMVDEEENLVEDIYFVNNTSLYAGYNWAHDQRPDKRATHVDISKDIANDDVFEFNVFVKNNVFYESNGAYVRFNHDKHYLFNVQFQNNVFYDSSEELEGQSIFFVKGLVSPHFVGCEDNPSNKYNHNWFLFERDDCDLYPAEGVPHPSDGYPGDNRVNDFINDFKGHFNALFNDDEAFDNMASILENPEFLNSSSLQSQYGYDVSFDDYSVCVGNGIVSPESGTTDFFGNERVSGFGIDVGCFEFKQPRNRFPRLATRAYLLHNGGLMDLNLEGQDMTMYLWDAEIANENHVEYDDRYSVFPQYDNDDYDAGNHGSMATGVIMSKGILPIAKGVAPQAKVVGGAINGPALYNSGNISTDDISEVTDVVVNNDNALISSNFYGDYYRKMDWNHANTGAYLNVSRAWDELLYNEPDYLMVTAAGNSGHPCANYDGESDCPNPIPLEGNKEYDKLTGNKTAKNNLVVANINDVRMNTFGTLEYLKVNNYTSQGPTDDYRIKPDIAALGNVYSSNEFTDLHPYSAANGTSMATPSAAGTLLLLQQHYKNINGNYMKAATLKGLALHTADDIIQSNQASKPTLKGPDAITGWGLLNARDAVIAITNNDTKSIIKEEILDQGETQKELDINSDNINTLIVSISWTDVPGTVSSGIANDNSPVLVNDLDLRVVKQSTGEVFYPYKLTSVNSNSTGDNKVDPFERVDIKDASGKYDVVVTHKGILVGESQPFSLVITGINNGLSRVQKNIETINDSNDIIVFPNPTDEVINVKTNSAVTLFEIYDVNGRLLKTGSGDPDSLNLSIDVTGLNQGIYFLEVSIEGKKQTIKFIKN